MYAFENVFSAVCSRVSHADFLLTDLELHRGFTKLIKECFYDSDKGADGSVVAVPNKAFIKAMDEAFKVFLNKEVRSFTLSLSTWQPLSPGVLLSAFPDLDIHNG